MKKINLEKGHRFGKLGILEEVESKSKDRRFECICDCGFIKQVKLNHLRSGAINSCGKCKQQYVYKMCICGKEMVTPYHNRKRVYCSNNCKIESQKKRKILNCIVCDKLFEIPVSKKSKCCNSSCKAIYNQSKYHRMSIEEYLEYRLYNTEKLLKQRKSSEYRKWRNICLERDGYKCKKCGADAECVHHIEYVMHNPERILDESNGVSLCNNCHKEIHKGKQQ